MATITKTFISMIQAGDSEQDGKLVVSSTPEPEGFSLATVPVGTMVEHGLTIERAAEILRRDTGMVVLAWQ